jgi:hypothetical protein
MFRTRLPSIFITCHKMQRLPRNLHVVTTWRSPRIVHGICPWMKVKILFAYVSFSFDYIVLYVFKLFVNLVYISYVIIWYYNVLYFITFLTEARICTWSLQCAHAGSWGALRTQAEGVIWCYMYIIPPAWARIYRNWRLLGCFRYTAC